MAPNPSGLMAALGQLEASLAYLRSDLARHDAGLRQQFRTAAIHGFKCSYDVATRTIRDHLFAEASPRAVRAMAFSAFADQAAVHGLVPDAPRLLGYRTARGLVPECHDPNVADVVLAVMDDFLADMRGVAMHRQG